jgi:hypothetical protein
MDVSAFPFLSNITRFANEIKTALDFDWLAEQEQIGGKSEDSQN